MPKFLIVLLGLIAPVSAAKAGCECGCIGGVAVPICQKPSDPRPVCGAGVCNAMQNAGPPPSMGAGPLNTAKCQVARVLNPYTTQYEWRRVCL